MNTQTEDDETDGLDALEGEVECEEKSPEGNTRVKALLGRRHTHNEELCVASCGVVLGRATFFGSEAINGVLVSTLQVFSFREQCS